MESALEGVVVLDLTRLTPGAYATLLLADMGADVIKVEVPGAGDYLRTLVPAAFETLCRDKRSVTVDLKSATGREMLLALAARADVVIENFRPGVCERLGIGYEQLCRARSDIIVCSLSGYGQSGPYRDHSGHDLNYLGVAGALSLMGRPDGPPEHSTGIAIADFNAATVAALSVVTALLHRHRTGEGQWLDVSMTDATASWMGRYLLEHHSGAGASRAAMMRRPGYGVYETADGKHLTLGCIEDVFWDNLLGMLPTDHPLQRHSTAAERLASIDEVEALLTKLFRQRNRVEWLEECRRADVPAAPVNVFGDMLDDPQLQARGMVTNDGKRRRPYVGLAVGGRTSPGQQKTAPELGEHNRQVWGSVGITERELERLAHEGVI